MLPMAGCRQPAIRAGRIWPCSCEFDPHTTRAEASGRSAQAPVCSRAPASAARNRMLQGEANSFKVFRCITNPVQTPKTKRPRVWRPEGVRVASGDRGDRSPRVGSVESESLAVGCKFLARHAQAGIAPCGRYVGECVNVAMNSHETGLVFVASGWRRMRTIRALFSMRNTFGEINSLSFWTNE